MALRSMLTHSHGQLWVQVVHKWLGYVINLNLLG